ncbi:hypothetical protein MKX03_004335 [Papaver bracteatum]|nr:hypothetical protein MKX03_004335 [Papaver bracteatum]
MDPYQNSQEIKRKSSGSSSEEQQQTPTTRVRISSSSSPENGSHHHSFEPSPEFKTTRDSLFRIMPQEPHLEPLENLSSSARNGFRLVLDIDFVNLAQKFSGQVDPVEFSNGIEEYASQLSTLEQNGYNVVRLRERFHLLRSISVDEKRIREIIKEKEEERKDKNVKACFTLNNIDSLKKELKGLEVTAKFQKKEIETLALMELSYSEERNKILEELSAVASAPW